MKNPDLSSNNSSSQHTFSNNFPASFSGGRSHDTNLLKTLNTSFKTPYSHSHTSAGNNFNFINSDLQSKFQCLICSQGFPGVRALKQHVFCQHPNRRDAFPFPCNLCSQGFFTKWSLKQHAEKHSSGSKCHLCSQVFTFYSNLLRHWAMSHGLRKCQRCKQMFEMGVQFDNHECRS